MRAFGAVTALALAATPAFSQGLPVFDEALGFDVRGTIDDGLILSNGGHVFYCKVEDGPDDRFFVLDTCAPIVGQKAAIAASRAAMSKVQGEKAFLEALEGLPTRAFIPAVTQTLIEFGCVLDFRTGEDAFMAVLARHVAEDAVYDGPMTDELIDAVGEITEDAAELMIDSGQIIVDRDSKKARLVDCP